ncbi:unnamed protein product, partial [Urochloa humidicola]
RALLRIPLPHQPPLLLASHSSMGAQPSDVHGCQSTSMSTSPPSHDALLTFPAKKPFGHGRQAGARSGHGEPRSGRRGHRSGGTGAWPGGHRGGDGS